MALVASHFRFASERFWVTLRIPLRLLVSALLLGLLGFLCWNAARRTAEQFWLAQAKKQTKCSPQRIALLHKAFAAEDRNYETAYNLGECYRLLSWQGTEQYRDLAKQALGWYQRAMDLNRWDPYSRFRYGMCLDWIGEHEEAQAYFLRAAELDPNGYFTVAHVGWHYFQTEDYATAKKWFQRSLHLYWTDNAIASSYLRYTEQRLADQPEP